MSANPYRAAGTFSGPAYTEREADRDLRRAIEQNQRFPYMLAPRQSGKSSLLNHLRGGLDAARFRCGFVDLSIFRVEELGDYDRFLARFFGDLTHSLGIPTPAVQGRPMADLLALLAAVPGPRVVLLIDEVDALRTSAFRDTFFSDIRSVFNDRATVPELNRVQFVLAGAARVEELITDAARSPFNVGKSIQLDDFSLDEVEHLCEHLRSLGLRLPADLPERLHHHTSGSPYLTQLLLEQLWDSLSGFTGDPPAPEAILARVDALADGIVAGAAEDIHFRNIAQMVEREPETLRLWRRAIVGAPLGKLQWDRLQITGLTGRDRKAVYRNRIYERVFAAWVWAIPRAVARRRLALAVVAVLAILATGFVWRAMRISSLGERIAQAALDVPSQAYEELRKLDPSRAVELMAGYWDRRAVEAEQTGTRDQAIILRLKARIYRDTPERHLAARVALDAPVPRMLFALRHEALVLSASFSADGSKVVTASLDKAARIWDATTGKPLGEPLRHHDRVWSASFSADGTKVVTASDDKTARIWDATTGQPLGAPLRHQHSIGSAIFSSDGRKLVSTSSNNENVSWILEDGAVRVTPEDRETVATYAVQLWDLATGKPLGDPIPGAFSGRFSADSRKLITANADESARIWDATTCVPLGEPIRCSGAILDASFSPNGRMLVTAGTEMQFWDASSGQLLGEQLKGRAFFRRAIFSPDGREVVTIFNRNAAAMEDPTIAEVWDAPSGQWLRGPMRHEAFVSSADYSADGRWIVTKTESCIRWWKRQDTGRFRLAGIRWSRGVRWIGEPWISRDGRDVKAAEVFTGDSIVVRSLRLGADDPMLPALSGSPAELLAEWQRRLALNFADESRSPALVPAYGLSSNSPPTKHPPPAKAR